MKYYVGDAFSDHIFGGGPAAVIVSDDWLSDEMMQNIAAENNLADTAFSVRRPDGDYDLRWFMPEGEINLNGHATLVCSHVIFTEIEPERETLVYHIPMGKEIRAKRCGTEIAITMPAVDNHEILIRQDMIDALGAQPKAAYFGENLLFVFENEQDVQNLKPDFVKMKALPEGNGCFVTAQADASADHDIVGRTFWPKMGVNEDPVCGNMHCNLAPFWTSRLGKTELVSHQLSKRGAVVRCRYENGVVTLQGAVTMVFIGELLI